MKTTQFVTAICAAAILSSFSSFAKADDNTPALTTLTALNCVANNGVTLKNSEAPKENDEVAQGLKVSAAWGFAKKEFNASLAPTEKANTLQINLDGKKGTEYILVLNADTTKATQTAEGLIYQPSTTKGLQARAVALVRCDVTLK
jgi:hypothetical protein